MNDAAQLYYAAQACFIELEHTGAADESVTDRIREHMDELWPKMSDAERARSRMLAAELLAKLPR